MSEPKLTQIKVENLGNLAIDEKNQLYWKRERLHTESLLGLSYRQKNLITIFTFLAAVATIANAVASWTTYLTRKPAPNIINPAIYIPAPPPPPTQSISQIPNSAAHPKVHPPQAAKSTH